MPALVSSKHRGTITWLGGVPDRQFSLRATGADALMATFPGVADDSHSGLTRQSCSRVTALYPLATDIRNTRQFSILSVEDMDKIAQNMGLNSVDPARLGASMVVQGIPDFTHLPPSSRLQFPSGATLTIDLENRPCNLPAKVIDEDAPGNGKAFKAAAKDLRGVTAWVEREGTIRVGDTVRLFVPDQRAWARA